ncbi:NAD(P)/FAD-dependent oxidoreductase [Venatoribacter cucullus]|uniref:NAD(P)/FAD-dependent oxidoreductase n=1 Tax=Venatoribacter cucullus TaxID=2661630 RepID=UPI00223F2BAD|nr:NAD(P)/FAD-dependent oxidoreductase [Venatoribacter cucullus]UZK02795.1 FAD-dependent oxidoreductase [Venatoribacter cucullus]
MSNDFDFCIAGGGVIGLALAYRLSQQGSVLLLERHARFGSETSSRNSEVIHAGLYYQPGSLKEQLCLAGKPALYAFCEQHDVPHRRIGKLIIAPAADTSKLDELWHKGERLGIPLERLNQAQLQEREPLVHGAAALWSPSTGIIDSHEYMQRLAQLAQVNEALLLCHSSVRRAEPTDRGWQVTIDSSDGEVNIRCGALINAAGLQAQSLARQLQLAEDDIPALYPCRGHYFSYQAKAPFRHLIYPLPEANMAGLGIHATLDLGGQVRFGPDTQYLAAGQLDDYRVDAALQSRFAEAIRAYFPQLDPAALQPDYAGIRPKLHAADQPAADFCLLHRQQPAPVVHLFGIESPGLTASLALAARVADVFSTTL